MKTKGNFTAYAIFTLAGLLATVAIVSAFVAPTVAPGTGTGSESILGSRISGPIGGNAANINLAGVTSNNVLKWNGTNWITSAVPAITGGGTLNYLPKFTASGIIGNSLIFDDGTNVGIGTATPGAPLDVRGSNDIVGNATLKIATANDSTRWGFRIGTSLGDLNLDYYNGAWVGTPALTVLRSNGNVGIGTTGPGQKLTVAGTVESTSGGFKFPDGTTQATAAGGGSPAGTITMYGGGSAPSGWLLADGSAVSRATYSALFTAIGTTYGAGDGSTTFNVPDLRGRAPIGMGQGSGLTNRSLNDKGGEEAHILTITEMPSHNHSGTFVRCEGCAPQNQSGPGYPTNAGYTTGGSVPSQGGGAAHNNMQPYITLNFIIKT